jgi:hypothetical protein
LNTRFHDTVTKSEPRLMSTAPSKPLENVLWSIQMLVADSCTLMASSSQSRNVMLRMMTLRSPLMLNPQPTTVAPELPRIVLFERTRSMPEHEIVPEIRITDALVAPSAEVSADALVTVVTAALPPPVVPPFWVAQPTRPVWWDGAGSTAAGRCRPAPASTAGWSRSGHRTARCGRCRRC